MSLPLEKAEDIGLTGGTDTTRKKKALHVSVRLLNHKHETVNL